MSKLQNIIVTEHTLKPLTVQMESLGFTLHRSDLRFTYEGKDCAGHPVFFRLDRHPQGWWQVVFGVRMELTYLDDRLVDAMQAVREFVRNHDGKM